MYDPTFDFTPEQLEIINNSYVTVPALREFWGKFPELELEGAIGGLKMAQEQLANGQVAPEVPETSKLPECEPSKE